MNLINRFSSRNQRLKKVFLRDRLVDAESYDRIAGYFRSSIMELVHEELSSIKRVRIVCNSDLDPRDINVGAYSQRMSDRAQLDKWHEQEDNISSLLERPRWKKTI